MLTGSITIDFLTKLLHMKNLLFAFCSILTLSTLNAQVPTAMPPDANEFYNQSFPLLRPPLKNIVLRTAKAMKNRQANSDSLFKALHNNAALRSMSNNDIQGIIVLIMVQASKDADTDLKNMVMGISHQNEEARAKARPSQKNTVNKDELQEIQNLRLQMIMDRKSKMAEEISYVMKRISGSQEMIINNLK